MEGRVGLEDITIDGTSIKRQITSHVPGDLEYAVTEKAMGGNITSEVIPEYKLTFIYAIPVTVPAFIWKGLKGATIIATYIDGTTETYGNARVLTVTNSGVEGSTAQKQTITIIAETLT